MGRRGRILGALAALLAMLGGLAPASSAGGKVGGASTNDATYAAVADAFVDKDRPRRNFGSAAELREGVSPVRRFYLRFSLDSLPDGARVLLKLDPVTAPAAARVRTSAGGWKEGTITWATAPAPAASSVPVSTAVGSGWTTTDVTSLVSTAGIVNLVVTADAGAASYSSREAGAAPKLVVQPPAPRKVFAFYYLWWSRNHWENKLGPNYPYDASPLPLPASLDDDGCNPRSLYEGNQLFDVPAAMYGQDDPGVIEQHVRQAAAAGISGFVANWKGTGQAGQTSTSISYSRRLAELFRAVNEVNAEGIPFSLILDYGTSHAPTAAQIINDWDYLAREYAASPALDRSYSSRPMIVWNSVDEYSLADLAAVSSRFRSTFFIVGSESWRAFVPEQMQHLDGMTMYWSSQNPYTNPSSFDQLKQMAASVRATGPNPDGSPKLWFAPFAPGYNHILGGGTSCVPRNHGQTMRELFDGNAASDPDGWFLISWNEITEGTFVEPLQRWGTEYLGVLSQLIRGS